MMRGSCERSFKRRNYSYSRKKWADNITVINLAAAGELCSLVPINR
ncbi:MAG: hypothetical protein FWG65_03525 [Turicibacter sp.]|nr:hypothetical protein [Turicibacter sp.]